MYKLYWSQGTASLAPQVILEETGVDYEMVLIDMAKSEHLTPEYLAINPFGKVPALMLPGGIVMTEAAAICLYLIEQHNLKHLAPTVKSYSRAQFLQWLMYLTNTIQENYKRYYYNNRFLPKGGDKEGIREIAIKDLIEFWKPIDDALAKSDGDFMLGQKISLLDIYLTMLVTWFQPMDELTSMYPALKQCFDECNKHPSVIKSMHVHG